MDRFQVSVSPHIRDKTDIPRIMHSVNLALLPALIGATYIFGIRALLLTLIAVASAMVTEALIQKMRHQPVSVLDGSAIITGILLAFNLPPGVPFWIPVAGSVFAIAIGKHPFGGLGYNPLNPALLGRAFLLASWPVHMTKDWLAPFWWKVPGYGFFSWVVPSAGEVVDGVTTATPLAIVKEAKDVIVNSDLFSVAERTIADTTVTHYQGDLIVDYIQGTMGGCIGETSALLLIMGALFLMYKRIIDWRIPFTYIGTVMVLGWIFGGTPSFDEGKIQLLSGNMLFHAFSGGLILGAFFMATDMVTSPLSKKGHLIFGFGCGALTIIIRLVGGYPEGVSYSILLMNLTVPLIDRYTLPKKFGARSKTG